MQTHHQTRRRRRRRGVTLFEVLIVVAILAMISAGVAFGVIQQGEGARKKFARSEAGTIRHAVQSRMFEGEGDCPTVDTLVALGVVETNGQGKDPWRQAYRITCHGAEVTVASSGPDRKPGTEDDIIVPLKSAVAAQDPP